MSNQLQGIRKAQVRTLLPEIHLLPQVEYNGRKIDAAKFGPDTYDNNLLSMGKRYYHSDALPCLKPMIIKYLIIIGFRQEEF